jgi:hypothetical protein
MIIKFLSVLTILSLTAGNISSALCSRILGIPVAKECRVFQNLEIFLSQMMFHRLQMNLQKS